MRSPDRIASLEQRPVTSWPTGKHLRRLDTTIAAISLATLLASCGDSPKRDNLAPDAILTESQKKDVWDRTFPDPTDYPLHPTAEPQP